MKRTHVRRFGPKEADVLRSPSPLGKSGWEKRGSALLRRRNGEPVLVGRAVNERFLK
jgi:hypothetical protein